MTNFIEAPAALVSNDIEFVVVGGLAMMLHGANTVTQDRDISFAIDPENCQRLVSALTSHRPRPIAFPDLLELHALKKLEESKSGACHGRCPGGSIHHETLEETRKPWEYAKPS